MTLSERMRQAAVILEEVSALYDYLNPECGEWSAERLRHEAQVIEKDAEELVS
jgi:hypothetical protein